MEYTINISDYNQYLFYSKLKTCDVCNKEYSQSIFFRNVDNNQLCDECYSEHQLTMGDDILFEK